MKIIVCIFLLNITAVSVFGEFQKLNGIVGKSIEFPAAVEIEGNLMYHIKVLRFIGGSRFTPPRNGISIGLVLGGKLLPLDDDHVSRFTFLIEKYKGRVHWDSSTGYFSLSGLWRNDSGVYTVEKGDWLGSVSTFILTVWEDNVPVSKPHVNVTRDEYPCALLCSVERGTEVTLSWYREGQKKPYVTSPVQSAPGLYLPQSVERSGTYTCKAKNSVSNETSDPLTVGAHCTAVFGQSVELNGIVGQSVKFPAAVKKGGFLMYSGVTIRDSSRGASRNVNYRDRVQWDSSTGFFSLSGLKMEDSGEYKVQNTDQNITVFQLNVYKDNVNVSKPHVSITQNEYPCTIECTAERGTEATLSWYREGEKKSFASSRVASAPHLHLPHSVESGTYTCEAKNSVSNEMASITVGDHCTAPTIPIMWILIAVVVLLLLLAIVAYCLRRRILRFRRRRGFIRRRLAVRTLIQVKMLIDNVDLHAYDETVPSDAVRSLIQVKTILDNVDPHEYAQSLLDHENSEASGKTRLELSPDDRRKLIQVKKHLNNLDLRASGEKKLELSPDDVKTVIDATKLLTDLDLHASAQSLLDHENSEASGIRREIPD